VSGEKVEGNETLTVVSGEKTGRLRAQGAEQKEHCYPGIDYAERRTNYARSVITPSDW